jgi:hypothetical protein
MRQNDSFSKMDPGTRWPRRRPHGNHQSEWRSRRNHRSRATVPDQYEAECRRAIAAFLDEQGKVDAVSD